MASDEELQAPEGGDGTAHDSVSFVTGGWSWSPGGSTAALKTSIENGTVLPSVRLIGGITNRGPLGVLTAFVFTPLSLLALVITQFASDTATQLSRLVGGYFDGVAGLFGLAFIGEAGPFPVTTPGLVGVAQRAFTATAHAVTQPAFGFVVAVALTLVIGFIVNLVIQYVR
ncbi:hypothetical protein [Halosegnis marinus]|uniref:Uncharacterized protein n=1 Tax=Halosegnis marinus TaxID=3034023 RepID=A0ABD5ZTD3_9EURY|nr:hypothetical protein [Halosegnis sp. DT85]